MPDSKEIFIAGIYHLLSRIHLSLAYNQMLLTDEEEELMEMLTCSKRTS